MGAIWSKKSNNNDDYERILSQLDEQIKSAELRLSEIKLRERRAVVIWSFYSVLAYIFYTVGFFMYLRYVNEIYRLIIRALPILISPFVILFIRSLFSSWYKRRESKEELALKKLKQEQHDKVEELKKKTSYYTTRNLIERFDENRKDKEAKSSSIIGRKNVGENLRLRNNNGQVNSHRPTNMNMNGNSRQNTPFLSSKSISNSTNLNLSTTNNSNLTSSNPVRPPPPELKPYERHWYDRLVDVLVGENEDNPNSKYALLCEKCFTHNGLALPSEIDEIQYICPRCGFLNRSRRDKRRGSFHNENLSDHHHQTERSLTPTKLEHNSIPSPLRFETSNAGDSSDSSFHKPLEKHLLHHREQKRREKLNESQSELDESNFAEDEAGLIPDGRGRDGGGHEAIDSGDNNIHVNEKKLKKKRNLLHTQSNLQGNEIKNEFLDQDLGSPRSIGGNEADIEDDGGEWEKMDTDE